MHKEQLLCNCASRRLEAICINVNYILLRALYTYVYFVLCGKPHAQAMSMHNILTYIIILLYS